MRRTGQFLSQRSQWSVPDCPPASSRNKPSQPLLSPFVPAPPAHRGPAGANGKNDLATGFGAAWQCEQCMHTAQCPIFWLSAVLSFSAGPSFMLRMLVRCSALSRGSVLPSMPCSLNVWNTQNTALSVQN